MTIVPVDPAEAGGEGSVAMGDFMELMHSFNEVTQQLEHTHDALRSQVESLQAELAEANERLRRSRSLAALGEMAAGIAHEIRNPLGSIALNVGLLKEDLREQPESLGLCEKVARAVSGLDAIVGDVLSFARDSALNPVACCPNALLTDVVLANEAQIEAAGTGVELVVPDDLNAVVDRGLVTQALTNLVRNACEALVSHPVEAPMLRLEVDRIMVRPTAEASREPHLRFRVEDNGPGVPAELRDRVFNPFFTTRETGTGLGLAIVHRIVDAHGGTLAIHDADPGTRVEMSFPLEPPRSVPAEDASVSLAGAVRDRIQNHDTARRSP